MNQNSENVALVTGATRGIGRAIALQLAEDGYNIAFCYHSNDQLAKTIADEIEELGSKVYWQQCDVSNYDRVQDFVKSVEKEIGTITVLVNNAGIIKDSPLVMMDHKDWNEVININLTGTFNFCKATVFNFMKSNNGCIINISSYSGVDGNRAQVNYAASKAGIIGLTKSLAKEVGEFGIRVNAVAPGIIVTDMTEPVLKKKQSQIKSSISLREFGEAEDVAHLVSFLASDKAKYITGQTYQVDGGLRL